MKSEKRRQLLDVGRERLLRGDIPVIPMDGVAREAGISKRTLYAYFTSRESFTAAVISHDLHLWHRWFFDAVRERQGEIPPILAFCHVLDLWTAAPEYRGCLFARALFAFQTESAPILQAAREGIDMLDAFFAEQTLKSGAPERDAIASDLLAPTLLVLSNATPSLRQRLIVGMKSRLQQQGFFEKPGILS